jgi:phosphoribosyl-ATP pyrophosphohydrolase
MSDVIGALWQTIEQRKRDMPEGSYTAKLFAAGMPRMAQKVGEEGVEVAVAALSQDDGRVLSEMADLMYHALVLLSARGLSWEGVEAELEKRFK